MAGGRRELVYQIYPPSTSIDTLVNGMVQPEMEKRADGADASVLFFLLSCANFLVVYAQIR